MNKEEKQTSIKDFRDKIAKILRKEGFNIATSVVKDNDWGSLTLSIEKSNFFSKLTIHINGLGQKMVQLGMPRNGMIKIVYDIIASLSEKDGWIFSNLQKGTNIGYEKAILTKMSVEDIWRYFNKSDEKCECGEEMYYLGLGHYACSKCVVVTLN